MRRWMAENMVVTGKLKGKGDREKYLNVLFKQHIKKAATLTVNSRDSRKQKDVIIYIYQHSMY